MCEFQDRVRTPQSQYEILNSVLISLSDGSRPVSLTDGVPVRSTMTGSDGESETAKAEGRPPGLGNGNKYWGPVKIQFQLSTKTFKLQPPTR